MVRPSKFYGVKHLSPLADTLPVDVCRYRHDQSPRFVPATQLKIRRLRKCGLDLVGNLLGQAIISHVPKLNERRFD